MKDKLQLWLLIKFTVIFPVIIILVIMLVQKLWNLLYGDAYVKYMPENFIQM